MQKGFATFMSTERGFTLPLVLVGILFLGLLGVGGYYFYQTKTQDSQNIPVPQTHLQPEMKEETAKWKTYANSEFSFNYPADNDVAEGSEFSMGICDKSAERSLTISPKNLSSSDNGWYAIFVGTEKGCVNADSETLINNFAENLKKDCSPPGCGIPLKIKETLRKYKSGENSGYIFHYGSHGDQIVVVISKNDKIYSFLLTGEEGYATDYGESILDKVVNSFRLLN